MAEIELVRIQNLDDKPFVGMYEGNKTVIAPGEEASFVRGEAAKLWFGNPDAIDHYNGDDLKEDRTNELSRLDARYGIFPTRANEPDLTREDRWPKVKVLDIHGNEVRMVIHDPEGSQVTPANAETVSERRLLMDTIEDLKARVERFEAQVVVPEGDTAIDAAPTGRSRARAV